MSKTFYVSSSSHPDNLPFVTELAARLQALGLDWYGGFSWVDGLQAESAYSEEELSLRVQADMDGAAHADLFVYLDSPYLSRGGMIEYGIRLFTGYVHHVGCKDMDYLFYRNYRVKHHATVDRLIGWLA